MKNRYSQGLTLIEVLITLMVASVLLGVGIPNFNQFIANNRMATAANDLVSAMHLARGEAIKRRQNVTICPSTNWQALAPTCNNGATLADGFIVFADCSAAAPNCGTPNLTVDAFDDVIRAGGPLPDDIRNQAATTTDAGGVEYLSFGPNGIPRNAPGFGAAVSNLQFCDHRGSYDTGGGVAAGRWVQITPTGRPQIYRDFAKVEGGLNTLNGC